ncbi:uncharacterized protein LOC121083158 [Falco naumanni]|uniref:uncharacterized protein LOC121083158 n=1 Tax=Falco naumanni TaxID=148594 RepID=UPI001ADE40E8|nr:uncharacterized protein LOC121083158 [Falco naumanni]
MEGVPQLQIHSFGPNVTKRYWRLNYPVAFQKEEWEENVTTSKPEQPPPRPPAPGSVSDCSVALNGDSEELLRTFHHLPERDAHGSMRCHCQQHVQCLNSSVIQVPLLKTGNSWWTDKNVKFRNPKSYSLSPAFAGTASPPYWQKPVYLLDEEDERSNRYVNDYFIIWMQMSAFATFRNLYRRIRWIICRWPPSRELHFSYFLYLHTTRRKKWQPGARGRVAPGSCEGTCLCLWKCLGHLGAVALWKVASSRSACSHARTDKGGHYVLQCFSFGKWIFNKWETGQRIPVSGCNLKLYGKHGPKQLHGKKTCKPSEVILKQSLKACKKEWQQDLKTNLSKLPVNQKFSLLCQEIEPYIKYQFQTVHEMQNR